jgi:hypothetical protein
MEDRTYRYISVPRTPEEWSGEQGRRLVSVIETGHRVLAEWVVDDFFLVVQKPESARISARAGESTLFGENADARPAESPPPTLPYPVPVEPAVNFCRPILISGVPLLLPLDLIAAIGQAAARKPCDALAYGITVAALTPAKVDSLRPTLRWRFDADSIRRSPDQGHSAATRPGAQVPAGTISKLRYEIRILQAEEVVSVYAGKSKLLRSISPVYEKSGLTETAHTLEQDLAPCTPYFWTVRALFEMDGVTHATEWGGNYWNVLQGNFDPAKLRIAASDERQMLMRGKPSDYAFPFSTLCEGKPAAGAVETGSHTLSTVIPPAARIPDALQSVTVPESSASTGATIAEATLPLAIEGTLLGKKANPGGLAALLMGIDIRLSFANRTGKDIVRFNGKVRLLDDAGKEIGVVAYRSDKTIPAYGNIQIKQTVFPLIFPGYARLKELEQEVISAEFSYESIGFADGTKVAR